MKADEILRTAANLVNGDRAEQHGDAQTCHGNIAGLWNAYLDELMTTPLTREDVAIMMALLKIARTMSGSRNPDNYVDGAAYLALAGQLADPPTE